MNFYDLFISNDPKIGYDLKELNNRLIKEEDLKIFWEKEDALFTPEQITNGIKNSKVFICFISQKYIESKSSKREIKYAIELKKPIIVIMMDDLKLEDLPISMLPITVINCWNREIYRGRKYNDLLTAIKKSLRCVKNELTLSDQVIQESFVKDQKKPDKESSKINMRIIVDPKNNFIEKNTSRQNKIPLKNRDKLNFNSDNESINNQIERQFSDADITKLIQNWWATINFGKFKDVKESFKSDQSEETRYNRIDLNGYGNSKINDNKEKELINDEIRKLADEAWGVIKNYIKKEILHQNQVRSTEKKINTFNYKNGDNYEGEILENLPHGYGSYTWANNDIYIGEWIKGQRHGKGILFLENGEIYEGEFLHNDFLENGAHNFSSGKEVSAK